MIFIKVLNPINKDYYLYIPSVVCKSCTFCYMLLILKEQRMVKHIKVCMYKMIF